MSSRTVLGLLVCAVVALIGTSCSSAAPGGARIAPVGETTPADYATLEITDMDVARAVAQLDSIAGDALAATGVPGMAIAVVHDDEVVYERGFGVREVGREGSVDAETVFQLASLSKPVGATVVAGVVGDGRVGWDDALVAHLPWFALSDPYVTEHVTIADMYAHRSGLPGHAGDVLEFLGFERDEVLHRLRLVPLAPFRVTYAYTNFGVTAAAVAVAKAVGMSWEDLSETRLYQRIGMLSTSSRFADYEASPNKARTHIRVDGVWEPGEVRDPQAQSPAGGVSSTVRDMTRWMRLVLANGVFDGRQVVDASALAPALTPQITSNPPDTPVSRPTSYGYGMVVQVDETGRVRFSHSGAFAVGAATAVVMIPAEQLGIVVLTNGMPIGVPEAVSQGFLDVVAAGRVQRDWLGFFGEIFAGLEEPTAFDGEEPPTDPAPPPSASALTGTYTNAYYGPADVIASDGELTILLGPRRQEFPLTHWDGITFVSQPVGTDAPPPGAVTFELGTDGRAVAFTVEALDENGLGTFTR